MMKLTRRRALSGLASSAALLGTKRIAGAAAARTLKISHQFPGGTADAGDFRDRLCRKFAAAVTERTRGELNFEIHSAAKLVKPVAQFSHLVRGTLDLSLYPLAYAGGEIKEFNIGLMPCLVTNYEEGMAWRKHEIGSALEATLDKAGVKLLTWIWQAGCIASRAGPVVNPEDVKGLKIRGGSREFDVMLRKAGGVISSLPSNQMRVAMQSGALDVGITSSTSLVSFKLEEIASDLTTGRDQSIWFMLEPLLMSKAVFSSLSSEQQKIVVEVGESLVPFGLTSAKADDAAIVSIFEKRGVKIHDLTPASTKLWRDMAVETAWIDFAARSENCAHLLKLAQSVKG